MIETHVVILIVTISFEKDYLWSIVNFEHFEQALFAIGRDRALAC